jgi:hypothetical protein
MESTETVLQPEPSRTAKHGRGLEVPDSIRRISSAEATLSIFSKRLPTLS